MIKADGEVHTLRRVEEETDLGVTIDSKLSFEHHISDKINKANKMAGLICRA